MSEHAGRPLSVLMFSTHFRPFVGGAERQAEKLASALACRGHRVQIVTARHSKGTPVQEQCAGVEIHRFEFLDLCRIFPRVRGLGLFNLVPIGIQTTQAMERHLDGVDVVHTHMAAPMSVFAMRAAKKRGLPVVCKVASSGERSDFADLSRILIGGRHLTRAMTRGVDRWVATTDAVMRSILAEGVARERIVTIPNGVHIEPAEAVRARTFAPRFLYLGRISRNANRDLETLVRAFEIVALRFPKAELALVGTGDLYDATAKLVSRSQHAGSILMPGEQDPISWLQWASVLVLPSRREGLSNALLEAMGNGLACIANDIPANREVLEDAAAGILVPVGDKDALVQAMTKVCESPQRMAELAHAAYRRAERCYSIDSVVMRYEALYRSMVRA